MNILKLEKLEDKFVPVVTRPAFVTNEEWDSIVEKVLAGTYEFSREDVKLLERTAIKNHNII